MSAESGPGIPLFVAQALLMGAVMLSVGMLPLYLSDLGVEGGAALFAYNAVAFGVGVGVSAIATPLWGALGERVGRRAMALRAAVGLTVCQVLLAMVSSPEQVIGLRALQGAISGVGPAMMALGAAKATSGAMGKTLGRLESAGAAGAMVGPALGVAAVWWSGFSACYVLAAVLAGLGALTLLAVPEAPTAPASSRVTLRQALSRPLLRDLVAAAMAIETTSQIIDLAWPVLLVSLTPDPVTQAAVGAVVEAGSEAVYLVAAPLLGALSDRMQPAQVVRCSAWVMAGASAMLPFAPGGWWLVPLALVADAAAAGLHPQLTAETASRVGDEGASTAIGILGAGVRTGSLVGAALSPLLAVFGPAVAIWTGAAGLAAAGSFILVPGVSSRPSGGVHVSAALDG